MVYDMVGQMEDFVLVKEMTLHPKMNMELDA